VYRARSKAAHPSNRCTASSTRDGWNGLTTKSLAARLDRLDHQRLLTHRAAHQNLGLGMILADFPDCLDAPMSGITMSMVTRIGLQLAIFLHRLGARLRLADHLVPGLGENIGIIVRMKIASSQTSTVWPTVAPPSFTP
jgi:hypothetical protein